MKRLFVSFFSVVFNVFIFNTVLAQSSGMVRMVSDNEHVSFKTIVRNYNDKYNIVMDYGLDVAGPNPNNLVSQYSTFYMHNIESGELIRLFKLEFGYCVNDVRFVALKRDSTGMDIDTFCCFCGTKYTYRGEELLPSLEDDPTPVQYVVDSAGFAGFFSMDDAVDAALNPSQPSNATAKVREVEGTSSLYRMASYSEAPSRYYEGSGYYENAVLDIIGITADTLNSRPCFARAKFYPEYNNSILWDNNLRYNEFSDEIICDVTSTNDYVVTVSKFKGNRHDVFLRVSEKESLSCMGGCELNDQVYFLDWKGLSICAFEGIDGDGVVVWDSLRLCYLDRHVDEYALAIGIQADTLSGILTLIYKIKGKNSFLRGSFERGFYRLSELAYMPIQNTNITLTRDRDSNYSISRFNAWPVENDNVCDFFDHYVSSPNYQQQSIAIYNGYGLIRGCVNENGHEPFALMFYPWARPQNANDCAMITFDAWYKASIDTEDDTRQFRIKIRYPYNTIKYPNYYIPFEPYIQPMEQLCE